MKIIAVVVTYNPALDVLHALLEALQLQVGSIVVVDNGSSVKFDDWLASIKQQTISGIFLGSNKGVAAAQNIGIERARQKNADYVVLFDQDSLPSPHMIDRLLNVAETKKSHGEKVAVVGPDFVDERNERHNSFLRVGFLRTDKIKCGRMDAEVRSDVIISSGSLIPMSALDNVGGMIDDLFIDQVDIEWCLRAQSQGYVSYGVCGAIMSHVLGDEPVSVLGYKFSRHSPLRHYYISRNSVWLLTKQYVPLAWKFLLLKAIAFRLVFYPVLVAPRWPYLKMMSTGIWHGLIQRMGCLK